MSITSKSAKRLMAPITAVDEPSVALSVVVPVTERYADLSEIYHTYADRIGRSFEFIFVLDGDFEAAARTLEPLQANGAPIRILSLPRRFGEATALTIGFEQARAQIIITLPSYFQVVPEGILKVLKKIDEGADLVVARRFPRVDPWINRIQTYGFHFLTRRLTNVQLRDISCGVKGIRKRVTQEIRLYGDLHRFFPLLAYQRGFHVVEVDIPQHPADGRTRLYRPGLYLRRLLDILTLVFLFKFTKKPLRFFGLAGAGLFGSGFLISLELAVEKIFGLTALANRPLLLLGVLLMVLGVQIASIGLLGELIIFTHARKLKDYTFDRVLLNDKAH